MDDALGDVFVGYNKWVIQKLKVEIFTDSLYEY